MNPGFNLEHTMNAFPISITEKLKAPLAWGNNSCQALRVYYSDNYGILTLGLIGESWQVCLVAVTPFSKWRLPLNNLSRFTD